MKVKEAKTKGWAMVAQKGITALNKGPFIFDAVQSFWVFWRKNNVFLATGVPLARWEARTAMQGRGDG